MEKLHTLLNLKNKLQGRLKAVAFDVDGTLYPNYQMFLASVPLFINYPRFVNAFRRMRRDIRGCETWGDVRKLQAQILSRDLGVSQEDAMKRMERIIYDQWERMFAIIRPFRGLRDVLDFLKRQGYVLAVLSDFPPERKLEFLGVSSYFDVVLCSDDSGYLKPDPRAFEFLLNRLGLAGEEVLFVGNNYRYDVVGAKGVGMFSAMKVSPLKFSAYLKSERNRWEMADVIFSSYRHFLEILRYHIIN